MSLPMCGRYSLTREGEQVARLFELADVPDLAPRYNIAPSQPVAVVLHDAEQDQRRCRHLRWGLIPRWAKDPAIGQRLINARSETAAQKPAFRAALRQRRCLLPADGFYEWQQTGGARKRPYYFTLADGGLFAIGGLWEDWTGADGEPVATCAILTTGPNELMRPVHDRMPLILRPADHARWLDPRVQESAALAPLLVPLPAESMAARTIGTHVNDPRHEGPRCLEPAGPAGLFDPA